jgi:hypothetical protein
LKREIGKLWENIDKAPYKELFNGSVPGMYVWRCVRLQRAIDRTLETILREIGLTSGREYGIGVHGNRMISALVFQHVNVKDYKELQADFNTLLAGDRVVEATRMFYGRLKDAVAATYGNALIPTLFKNQTKCRDLFEICLNEGGGTSEPVAAELAEGQAAPESAPEAPPLLLGAPA